MSSCVFLFLFPNSTFLSFLLSLADFARSSRVACLGTRKLMDAAARLARLASSERGSETRSNCLAKDARARERLQLLLQRFS